MNMKSNLSFHDNILVVKMTLVMEQEEYWG